MNDNAFYRIEYRTGSHPRWRFFARVCRQGDASHVAYMLTFVEGSDISETRVIDESPNVVDEYACNQRS